MLTTWVHIAINHNLIWSGKLPTTTGLGPAEPKTFCLHNFPSATKRKCHIENN